MIGGCFGAGSFAIIASMSIDRNWCWWASIQPSLGPPNRIARPMMMKRGSSWRPN